MLLVSLDVMVEVVTISFLPSTNTTGFNLGWISAFIFLQTCTPILGGACAPPGGIGGPDPVLRGELVNRHLALSHSRPGKRGGHLTDRCLPELTTRFCSRARRGAQHTGSERAIHAGGRAIL